jgi:Fe-S oxidoreductase
MEPQTRQDLLKLFESKLDRTMRLYLETCTRCGICTEACHAYASLGQIRYSAAFRHEIIRRLFKKYFKSRGKWWPVIAEAKVLDEKVLVELNEAAYSCTGCRRCMVYCPFGIDTQMLMSIAKLLLIGAHAEPEILTMLADMSVAKGESLELYKESFKTGIKNLEAEMLKQWKLEAGQTAIPIDVPGADLLYVALAGAHSIVPAAAAFNAAGEKWTLSFFEAVNFGAFVGDPLKTKLILDRIVNEAKRLQVKEVCICECGTAFRTMKQLAAQQPFRVSSLTEVQARYLRQGRIKLAKEKLKAPVTYHDPCQIARNGGVITEPRLILQQLTDDYREMAPDPRYNWCCGGGGGLVALGDDNLEFRMKSARVKAEQIKQTGAKILVTACENCHSQLSHLNAHYQLGVEVKFLSALVADALVP